MKCLADNADLQLKLEELEARHEAAEKRIAELKVPPNAPFTLKKTSTDAPKKQGRRNPKLCFSPQTLKRADGDGHEDPKTTKATMPEMGAECNNRVDALPLAFSVRSHTSFENADRGQKL